MSPLLICHHGQPALRNRVLDLFDMESPLVEAVSPCGGTVELCKPDCVLIAASGAGAFDVILVDQGLSPEKLYGAHGRQNILHSG